MSILDVLKNSGPSLLWPMTDAASQQTDVSGSGQHGAPFGTVSYQYGRPTYDQTLLCGRTASGSGNKWAASSFPSVAAGTALSIFTVFTLNAAPATIKKVVGLGDVNSSGGLLYMDAGGAADKRLNWFFATSSSNQDYLSFRDPSGGGGWYVTPLNTPVSVGITVNTANLAVVYLNGRSAVFDYFSVTDHGNVTSATLAFRNNSGNFEVGHTSDGTFTGSGDITYGPTAAWTRVLSADEIAVMHREISRGGVVLG